MKEEKNAQTEAAEAEEIKEEKTQNPAEDSAEA